MLSYIFSEAVVLFFLCYISIGSVIWVAIKILDDDAKPLFESYEGYLLFKKRNNKKIKTKPGELELKQKVGTGHFGETYFGFWMPAKYPVAVKVMNLDVFNEEKVINDDLIKVLKHKHVLQPLAIHQFDKQLKLISPLMPLGNLLWYMKIHKENINSKLLLIWCLQIAKGMADLEVKGIIHRNLKAKSILVQNPHCVKISGFGLAKMLESGQTQFQDTNDYQMPVEWLALESIETRTFSHKSDVWSYAVTVWELLNFGEKKPFDGLCYSEIKALLEVEEKLDQPRICSFELYFAIAMCWNIEPEERPPFKELVKDLSMMSKNPSKYLIIPNDKQRKIPEHSNESELLSFTANSLWENLPKISIDKMFFWRKRPGYNKLD